MRDALLTIALTSSFGISFALVADDAKPAAEKGDAAAQFRYGEMLRDGRGVAKSMKETAKWTRKAADAGDARAQCQMGLFYINGLGVDQDEGTTEEWLEKSAVADICSHSIEPMVNTSE